MQEFTKVLLKGLLVPLYIIIIILITPLALPLVALTVPVHSVRRKRVDVY